MHFSPACAEWSCEEQECTHGFVAVPCSPAQANLGIWKVVNAWRKYEIILFTCTQYLLQKPVEDLEFKIMFILEMLLRSCSSFELIAMRICNSSCCGVLSYFKSIQQNVYFWYLLALCLHMHGLCEILLFSVPQLNQHSIFARKMLDLFKNPLNSFYKPDF